MVARDTKHESGVGMPVRFNVGAKGSQNQEPPPGPPRPPPSHCFPAHYSPQLKILPLSQCPLSVHTIATRPVGFSRITDSPFFRRGCARDAHIRTPRPDRRARRPVAAFKRRWLENPAALCGRIPVFAVSPLPSAVHARPHGVRHGLRLPSPSGLLPLRRTQNEPMLRKGNVPILHKQGNVLYCVDRRESFVDSLRGRLIA